MNQHSVRLYLHGFVLLLLLFAPVATVNAQSQQSEYLLNVNRNFGFSSGSQIRGTFTLSVIGPESIQSVTYRIDGQVMAQVSDPPFRLQFQTRSYPIGWHELAAEVHTLDGRMVPTPVRRFEFVSSEEEFTAVQNLLIPMLGGLFLLVGVMLAVQMLVMRKRPLAQLAAGAPRQYGAAGGAVCPRCHRPYPLHWWAPNTGINKKFDRCEFCGKWAVVKRASLAELRAAEQAELESTAAPPARSGAEADALQEMLDRSRYVDEI